MKFIKAFFIVNVAILLFTSCKSDESLNSRDEGINQQDSIFENEIDAQEISIEVLAQEYLSYLNQLDFLSLEELNRGEKVLFSPYLYIDTTKALEFSFIELKNALSQKTIYSWGVFDGTGETIELDVKKYFARFVTDVNYLDDKVAMNIGEVQPRGNSLSNLTELFPKATFVEFHHAPINEELMGMDWRSLIFVFQQVDNETILKGIIHNEWTI